jgi:predicted TIM-barrel fold metal-dependent hydrolase
VLGHAGGYRLHEAFMVAKSNPNVFLDISFTPVYFRNSSLAADCAFVCQRLPPGRVVYGSDFPHVPFGESLTTIDSLLDGIDSGARGAIMGAAACRLYAIPTTES